MTAAEPAEIQRLVEELDGMLSRLRLRLGAGLPKSVIRSCLLPSPLLPAPASP